MELVVLEVLEGVPQTVSAQRNSAVVTAVIRPALLLVVAAVVLLVLMVLVEMEVTEMIKRVETMEAAEAAETVVVLMVRMEAMMVVLAATILAAPAVELGVAVELGPMVQTAVAAGEGMKDLLAAQVEMELNGMRRTVLEEEVVAMGVMILVAPTKAGREDYMAVAVAAPI